MNGSRSDAVVVAQGDLYSEATGSRRHPCIVSLAALFSFSAMEMDENGMVHQDPWGCVGLKRFKRLVLQDRLSGKGDQYFVHSSEFISVGRLTAFRGGKPH